MSSGPIRILKGALWIQAAILLVLTSILADSNAWIGAIVSGVGFLFVVIGIVAAHKQRIGYLYCYATLVGLWEILALAHILIICGLIVLPPTLVKVAYVVGQKVVENPSDAMKIVIPMLYGLQWATWCITLVCLASLRLATRDSAVALEIQDPKRPHSLETSRSQSSLSSNPRMNQHLFNFRQSVISPHARSTRAGSMIHGTGSGPSSSRSGSGGEVHSASKMYKGKESFARQYPGDSDTPQAPERTWVGMERRSSSDSNAIFFPNDSRISQVVVTFRDDAKDSYDQHASSQIQQRPVYVSQPPKSTGAGVSRSPIPGETTIYIADQNYDAGPREGSSSGSSVKGVKDVYTLKFSPSGESLSDMIFKSSQDKSQSPKLAYNLNSPRVFDHASMAPDGLSSQYRPKFDIPNPARIRATDTKASLTLSSDSSSSELPAVSIASSSECGDLDQEQEQAAVSNIVKMGSEESIAQETVVADLAMISTTSLDAVSRDLTRLQSGATETPSVEASSKANPRQDIELSEPIKPTSNIRMIAHDSEDPSSSANHDCADEPIGLPPQMQPNSSDSSPSLSSLSSLSSSSSRARREDRPDVSVCHSHHSHHRNKPVLSDEFGDIAASEVLANSSPEPFSSPLVRAPAPGFEPTTMPTSDLPPSPTSPQSPTPIVLPAINTADTATSIPVSRSKSSIVSSPLQYWRNRVSSHSTDPSASSTPSFPQSYITNTFSKKKKLIIPTIVLHPDEEDGEPPRVLSQKDIDYLSTMPPAPLRLLIQPWDEGIEEDEYDDRAVNEGYDYDDYHHRHHHEPFGHGVESEEFGEVDMDEHERFDDSELGEPGEFDPYAPDVPIDLDVDLRELGRDNVKSGYGYI
ncbi:hypothetical protein BGX26_001963 [Mortierella sp. AD094]|nr:hypothetical protein BGX26_001963 [Mortierella sp. AD094]